MNKHDKGWDDYAREAEREHYQEAQFHLAVAAVLTVLALVGAFILGLW